MTDLEYFEMTRRGYNRIKRERAVGIELPEFNENAFHLQELSELLGEYFRQPSDESCQQFFRGYVEWMKIHPSDFDRLSSLEDEAMTNIEHCLRNNLERQLKRWRHSLKPPEKFFTASNT